MLARAPGRGLRDSGSSAGRLAGPRHERSVAANAGVRRDAGGLVRPSAKQRDALPGEKCQRSRRGRVRLREERGARDEGSEKARAEAARPEERHRNVEAFTTTDAAHVEAARDGPQRAAVGMDDAFRRTAAARGEQDDELIGGPHGFYQRVGDLATRR